MRLWTLSVHSGRSGEGSGTVPLETVADQASPPPDRCPDRLQASSSLDLHVGRAFSTAGGFERADTVETAFGDGRRPEHVSERAL